jgi:hypothetical protein
MYLCGRIKNDFVFYMIMVEENNYNDKFEEVEEEQCDESGSLMDKPFDPAKIKIETKTPSLDTLIRRIKNKTIQLNTETYFQRQGDLWNKEKQSRLIESILINFPLPAFFFDATDDNNWLIVDGLQRLSSIRNFLFEDMELTNLEFLTYLNGKRWKDLSTSLQTIIEESQVVIYKILSGTPTEVKFNIFKRINTGGLVLEPQEIRHALFQGKPAKFIAELAENEQFIKATTGPSGRHIDTSRMLDRDFANRFLCFYLFGIDNYGTKEYGQDLDTYMSNALAVLYNKSDKELNNIKDDFEKAMILSQEIFEHEAFRKVYYKYNRLPPINKALFDAISTQFAILPDQLKGVLLQNKRKFKESLYDELAKQDEFFVAITNSTADKKRIICRHNIIKELINNIIHNKHDTVS